MEEALVCIAMHRFAGMAVFAISEVLVDPVVWEFASQLGPKGYPTIAIIAPNPAKLVELARIEGFFPAKQLAGHMETYLEKAAGTAAPTVK